MCPTCSKCPQCCTKSTCRGQTSNLLANLVRSGSRSESSSNPERGLPPPLSDLANTLKVSHSHKPLCQSPQKPLPVGGITSAYRQKHSGAGAKSDISGVFQLTIFSPKTQQQVETYTRSEQTEPLSKNGDFQDGNSRNHQNFPPTRRVGDFNRFQRRLLPHTNTGTIQEISQISCPGSDIPTQGSALRSVHSTHGVHCGSKGSKTDGYAQGYKNPPVPRRLVDEGKVPPYMSPTYPNASEVMPGSRMDGELGEIRTGTKTSLRLCRLPVRPQFRPGPTDPGRLAESSGKDSVSASTAGLLGLAVHVLDRSVNSHREASSTRPTPHETHTVASQKQLESTGIPGKGHSNPQITAPSSTMVAARRQRSYRSTITPYKVCSANLYRRIKRRVGRSLKQPHCKRGLVLTGKQTAHKLLGIKGSPTRLERVSRPLHRQYSSGSNRQHYSSVIHKQGRRDEVGPTLCSSMENSDLVYQTLSDECGGRQATPPRPDNSNRMVPPLRGFSSSLQQVAPARNRPICHEVQQQVTSVRITSPRPTGSSSGCTQFSVGGAGCLHLPTGATVAEW